MIKKLFQIIALILVVLLSLRLRLDKYSQIPIPGQSVDEYSYSWVGLSLLTTGMPIGNSGISGYENQINKYINIDRYMEVISSDPFAINFPWMDHPPLMGLITGSFAKLKGAISFEDTSTVFIRKPVIYLSTLSVILVIVYCWLNFSYVTALFAGLAYGTTPLVVLSGRMIQAENGIIPCLLLVMIALSLYLKNKRDYWLIIAAIFSGIATLFKLTGVMCYLLTFFTLLNHYRKFKGNFVKDYLFYLFISLPISFLFVIYGLSYGAQNFVNIFFSNSNRFYGIGPDAILELIRNQRLTHRKFLPETPLIFGWLSFFIFLYKNPKFNSIKIPVYAIVSYLIIYLLFGSQPYGWYTFPFWPLLIILLSALITSIFSLSQNNIVISLIFSISLLGSNISRLLGIFEFQPYANIWRFFTSVSILVFQALFILKKQNNLFAKIFLIILWLAIFYTNYLYLSKVDINFWWHNIS